MKSRLSMKACSRSCCHTWAALSPSCAGSRRKGTGANIYQPPLQEMYWAGRLQVVTGKATRGGGRSVSRGRQEGSRAKLRWRFFAHRPGAPCGVALLHGHGARWPGRSSTRCAEPSCCPPPLNLRILSSASARASAGVHTGPHRRRQSAQGKRRPRGSCSSRLRCRHVPPRTLRLGFACELPGARALPRPLNESRAF